MLNSIKSGSAPAALKKVTDRQFVKAAATVRNQTVTYGGVTPLELAFGRRPADLIQLDVATPTQLTIDRNEEEPTAIQIKQLSKQAFQEARQSEDMRRDLAQNFRMSSKPFEVKDNVFCWQEDKSKIRSDGGKGEIWLKGKVISLEGVMVGLDLGSRLIKVNMTKVRKDETIPRGNLELASYCLMRKNPCRKNKEALPFQLQSQHPHDHYALLENQLLSLQHRDLRRTCSWKI